MAKIVGLLGVVLFFIGIACLAADGVLVGLIVLGVALVISLVLVHLVGMAVYGDWWPWRHL